MAPLLETTSLTVPYRKQCEDQVAVREIDGGVVIAVADGAGGTSAGDYAARAVVRTIMAADVAPDPSAWCAVLRQADGSLGAGESTGVAVAWTANGIVGASVGDSQAWLIVDGELVNLTRQQVRKPLLGSGAAVPVGFVHPPTRGLLLVATDGFCNYVKREGLLREILWIDFAVLASRLVEMVRLPSGELWDDIGIVACRPRPPVRQHRRYEL